jgi:hypothetical protein
MGSRERVYLEAERMMQRMSLTQPAVCVVCAAVLGRSAAADPFPSCETIACRMIVSRRAELGEAGFRHYLRIQAGQTQCRLAEARISLARRQAEQQENASAWAILHAMLPVAVPDPLRLVLPSGPPQAYNVTAQRRRRYRKHLHQVIAEAHRIEPGSSPLTGSVATRASESKMPGQLCALCGGGCCTRGGDHAYLSAASLRRFMALQPEMSANDVVAAYLDRLPRKSQAGSCINHTSGGCGLPREMRSDTCNNYACESLARLQFAQRGTQPPQAVLIVRRKQDNWHRTAPGLDNMITDRAVLSETGVDRA